MDCAQPGSSGMRVMTRNDLFNIMERSNTSTFDEKLQCMERELLNQCAENDQNIADVKQKLSIIRHQFKQKWLAARKTKARFLENNAEWQQMQYKMKFENEADSDANIPKFHGTASVDLRTGKKNTVAKSYPIFTTVLSANKNKIHKRNYRCDK
ncbi:hypothetical protein HF086_008546 [Spodoptera exigua]|uniref:Uncharacterized protein n=1 Tax=Spodoptera exigua TaxID=7107 RepID=A0A922M2H7_SPOEX|nr:hypothetical protein HF086_008546 [Spodoptera exigua]